MTEPRRLSDAELLAQLRRRSSDEPARSDHWRNDFVVGVGEKIDSGAPSVMKRRLPAFAGLSAAVAILMVLVVAIPGIGPGGGSPSSSGGMPSVSAVGARDFATRLAGGELDGDTVLVTGRILPYDGPPLYGATCSVEREQPVQPNFTCTLGRLDGIDPTVYVEASYVATPIDDTTLPPGSRYVWAAPQLPIEGVLALSVDEFRRVTFVGRDPEDRLTSSLPDVSALALESVALEEIRVVPAWLTGIVAPISCGPPDPGTHLADLPGRRCANPSWLAPGPSAVDPNGYTIPSDWLQVQSNAYLDFAPDPAGANGSSEPRAGLYVIAKRLEGSGCPGDQPPCWQWEVVGRVTINEDGSPAEPASTPSPTVQQTALPTSPASSAVRFECVGPPLPPGTPSYEGPVPQVVDETGLVTGCLQTDSIEPLDGEISLSNPFNNDAIEVVWAAGACDAEIIFTFRSRSDGYDLIGERPIDCVSSSYSLPVYITFSRPISAETVSGTLRDLPPTHTPDPTTTPRTIECAGAPAGRSNGAVWIEDHTGLVRGCEVGAIEAPHETSVRFQSEPPSVTLSWMTPCTADMM